MNPRWQVTFKGQLSSDARDELAHAGMEMKAEARTSPGGTELANVVWERASDADNAISRVKATLAPYGAFEDFKASPVNWMMYLGFLESEASAIEAVVSDLAAEDPRLTGVVLSEPTKGSAEILLEVPAATRDEAITEARTVYADLRSRAVYPPPSLCTDSWVAPATFRPTRSSLNRGT
jgi:hypothetical protein